MNAATFSGVGAPHALAVVVVPDGIPDQGCIGTPLGRKPAEASNESAAMPFAFGIMMGAQLVGELLRRTLHLPLPGALIGMFLLTVVLVARGSAGAAAERAIPPLLLKAANGLIANMGLLFVPAGVGIIAELGVLRHEWLAILAGLLISTLLGLAVTGLVMHHVSRLAGDGRGGQPDAVAEQG